MIKYLGGRIHAEFSTLWKTLTITQHNGRAVIAKIVIPKDGVKTLRELLKDLE